MLIQSLKYHFPARLPEWFMALCFMVPWGIYTILHPHMWEAPATAAMLRGMASMVDWTGYHPSAVWGLAAIIVGLVRAAALFINGAYARTPVVRLLASAVSAFLISQIIAGLIRADIATFGLVTYTTLFLLDVASGYRAASDIPLAQKSRIHAKEGIAAHDGRR